MTGWSEPAIPDISALMSSRKDLVGNSDGVGPRLMPRNSFAIAGRPNTVPQKMATSTLYL